MQATRIKIHQTLDRRRSQGKAEWQAATPLYFHSSVGSCHWGISLATKDKDFQRGGFPRVHLGRSFESFERSDLVQGGRKVTVKGCQAKGSKKGAFTESWPANFPAVTSILCSRSLDENWREAGSGTSASRCRRFGMAAGKESFGRKVSTDYKRWNCRKGQPNRFLPP